jgi:hypothetical protein
MCTRVKNATRTRTRRVTAGIGFTRARNAPAVSLLRCARGRRDSLRDAPRVRDDGEKENGVHAGAPPHAATAETTVHAAPCASMARRRQGRGAPGRCTAAARARTRQVVSSAFGWQSSAGRRRMVARRRGLGSRDRESGTRGAVMPTVSCAAACGPPDLT